MGYFNPNNLSDDNFNGQKPKELCKECSKNKTSPSVKELEKLFDKKNKTKSHYVVYNFSFGAFGLSSDAEKLLKNLGVDPNTVARHDERLVKVVRQLGKKANGEFSNLKIHKLKGNQYCIKCFDEGDEVVLEPDTIEWIEI